MWLLLSLAAALFTSLTDVLGKKVIGRCGAYVVVWGMNLFAMPFLFAAVCTQPLPVLGSLFWMVLMVQGFMVVIASILYFKAIEVSDLSLTVPMLTFTPLFLLITSPLMLGEFPNSLGLWGILLIVVGSYVLNITQLHKGYLAPFKMLVKEKGPRYMLMVALLYSVCANIDKIGVRQSSPLVWAAALNVVLTIALGLIMLGKSSQVSRRIKEGWKYLVLLGITNACTLIANMVAIQLTLVPYLIAIKRLSVFMTLFVGFVIFKEKGCRERSIGAVLMVLGAVLISLAH